MTRHGRIGSDGRETEKPYDSGKAAQKAAEKLIAQKTRKGYAEVEASREGDDGAAPKAPVEPGGAPDEQWRDELLAASAQATITLIEEARADAPDASAHRREQAQERGRHAALHRRAQELPEHFTSARLGAAWLGALEPGDAGTRHRSAIFSRAILDALEPNAKRCPGCSFRLGGPLAAVHGNTLLEHAETSWPGCDVEITGVVATLRGFGVEVADVMDHLLDMSDGAEEAILDEPLREAVQEAAEANDEPLIVEVRS